MRRSKGSDGVQDRAWGVNPRVRWPASGGKPSQAAAGQPGYRKSQSVKKGVRARSGARLAKSYRDASLTAPGAQNVYGGPGNTGQLPQVEAEAVALGKLFHSSFGDCTFDDKASRELVGNMMRHAAVVAYVPKWAEGGGGLPGRPVAFHLVGTDAVQGVPGRVDGRAPRGAGLPPLRVVPGRA